MNNGISPSRDEVAKPDAHVTLLTLEKEVDDLGPWIETNDSRIGSSKLELSDRLSLNDLKIQEAVRLGFVRSPESSWTFRDSFQTSASRSESVNISRMKRQTPTKESGDSNSDFTTSSIKILAQG